MERVWVKSERRGVIYGDLVRRFGRGGRYAEVLLDGHERSHIIAWSRMESRGLVGVSGQLPLPCFAVA